MARHKSANALLTAALSVSLGAAICATLFVLLLISTPLPYPEPQRLFVAQLERPEAGEAVQFSYPAVELLKREAHEVLEPVVAIDHARDLLLSHPAQPLVRVTYTSPGYAELFAPAMAHGRFLRGEPEDAPVAVISHAAWLSLFERRADVIGLNLQTAVGSFEIIGVTAADFAEPELHSPGHRTAVWLPWSENPTPRLWGWSAGTDSLSFLGRLLPGQSPELAGNRLSHRLGQAWIEAAGASAQVPSGAVPRVALRPAGQVIAGSGLELAPWLLIGALGLIAITLANIAHVMVARVAERGREFSIQRALGANTGRLYAQVLIDTLGLILPAGLMSLLVVAAGIAAMQHYLAEMLPRLGELSLDWRAVLFGLGGAGMLAWALASIAFLSCLQYTRVSPQTLGRTTTRLVPRRLRAVLMSAQIGLAGVLIAASFGLLREAARVLGEQGIDLERTASLFLYQSATATPGASAAQQFDEVRRSLSELPKVERVSQSHSPLQDFIRTSVVSDRSGLQSPVGLKRIDAGYLGLTGQKLAQGRNFRFEDIQQGAAVALVNTSFARVLEREGTVLGTVLTRDGGTPHEVVGVVDDLRYPGGSTFDWHVYLPASTAGSNFLLRFHPGEAMSREAIVAHVAAVNGGLGVFLFDDLSQQRSQILLPRKLAAAGTCIIALVVILAAALGLHGMIDHSTRQMRGELGTRLAFGARPPHVLLAVAKQHGWAFVFGATLSMAAALLLVGLLPALGALSFNLHWMDLGAALALLALLAGLACVVSVRPLVSQAPAEVLRGE